MSKKYKGELCVYCAARPADTADHIFARGFFLQSRRQNLPQGPACAECNGIKSSLEHYLQPVLAFGGRHSDAAENLRVEARRKLKKDGKLYRRLAAEYTETSLPLDWDRVVSLFSFVVRALMWHHWKVYLDVETHSLSVVTEADCPVIDELISQAKSERRVSADLGNRTFVYKGAQTCDDPQSTVWKVSIYGGLEVADDHRTSSNIVIYTKPR
jgi:hypothetical protein